MTIHFDYRIGDLVLITALNTKARVSIVRWDGINQEYYVSYWIDGDYKQHWIHREDLK